MQCHSTIIFFLPQAWRALSLLGPQIKSLPYRRPKYLAVEHRLQPYTATADIGSHNFPTLAPGWIDPEQWMQSSPDPGLDLSVVRGPFGINGNSTAQKSSSPSDAPLPYLP